MTDRTLLEYSERMAKQEERMSTHQAKYESALDRLRADMAKRDAQRDADAAKRSREASATPKPQGERRSAMSTWRSVTRTIRDGRSACGSLPFLF